MMYKDLKTTVFLFYLVLFFTNKALALPVGFVYLQDIDPSIIQEMKYFSPDNFVGKPINGYKAGKCIVTIETAQALKKAQQRLKPYSLGLKVFDCYRPQQAVNEFVAWSQVIPDQKMKKDYYPRVNKADFFKLGYVAEKSGHTRGSTVDLTIINLRSNKNRTELEMGTHFDFMDETSFPLSKDINLNAQANRLLLREIMNENFLPYEKEWWHFTLKNEPFPHQYFNFTVE